MQSEALAEQALQVRGLVHALMVPLLFLSIRRRRTSALFASSIERACGIASDYGAYRLRTLRNLIDRDAPRQETMSFMSEHPMIRPLSDYARFVHDAFQKEIST